MENKRHIFQEISIPNKGKFREKIGTHTPLPEKNIHFTSYQHNSKIIQIQKKKSKYFLQKYHKKIENPYQEAFWRKAIHNQDSNFKGSIK